jgi:hypothetical protein
LRETIGPCWPGDGKTERAIRKDANRLAVKFDGDDLGILGGPMRPDMSPDAKNRRAA